MRAWVGAALPRSTRQIGAWIEKEFGLISENRSRLIALLHRLGWSTTSRRLQRRMTIEQPGDYATINPTNLATAPGFWANPIDLLSSTPQRII